MKKIPYTYSIIRYVHDPAAGETLNVGILLYAPTASWLGVRVESRYERLSKTFRDFEGEHFRETLRRFEGGVSSLREKVLSGLQGIEARPGDVAAVAAQIWPDQDLSFRIGPSLAGIADDLEDAIDHLFNRMVLSQYPADIGQRRTDEDVWSVYSRPLERARVVGAFREKEFKSSDFEIKFEHAFKNHQWHVLQPVSFDYKTSESIQKRAVSLLGSGTALDGQPELGTIYFLLGRPRTAAHSAAFTRAKNLLNKVPVKHDLVEEDDAKDFAKHLADKMKKDGVEGIGSAGGTIGSVSREEPED